MLHIKRKKFFTTFHKTFEIKARFPLNVRLGYVGLEKNKLGKVKATL